MLNTIQVAVKAILTNKVRAFLTMLGVIIGVGSVVLLTSIGTGLQIYIEQQFADLGTDTIFVIPGDPFGEGGGFASQERAALEAFKSTITRRMLINLLRDNRDLLANGVAAGVGTAEAKYQDVTKDITINAVTPEYEQVANTSAETGNWYSQSDEEKGERVVMLGPAVAEELFGKVDPVNKTIRLDGQSYRVSGVLEEKGGSFGGPSFDNYVYMPLTTLQDEFDIDRIDNFMIEINEGVDVEEAKDRIEKYLVDKENLEEDDFTVIDQTQLLETIQSILGVLTAGLGGIAAISLVVGGIGIMNIMLVSVTERTREIGLRKALGATPNTILLQFLTEAALLSVLGGGIGLLVAYLGSLAIQTIFPAQITLGAVVLAFGVSTIVGLIFGAAPAKRAADLSPIEALRYE